MNFIIEQYRSIAVNEGAGRLICIGNVLVPTKNRLQRFL